MNLVEQIFEQAKLGTAPDPNANPFAEGMRMGLQQQQIDAEKQRLAMEIAQMPLKQTLLQQEAAMNALKLQQGLQTQQDTINNEQAYQGLAAQVGKDLQSEHPENAEASIFDAISKNKGLYRHPGIAPLLQDARQSVAAKVELQKLKAKPPFTPEIIDVPNPIPGMPPTQVLRTSEGQVQPLKDPTLSSETSAEKNFTRLDQLQQALTRATVANDPAAIADAKRKLETFSALATPPSETISFDPKTGALTVTKGKQLGDVTTATATRLQESVQSAISNIDVANRLEPLITTETVGARAFAESWIKDRVLAQAFPELASSKRANAEALAAQLRATAVQQLKSDGNISEKERAQILQAVPEINSPIDSPARAKQLIAASRKMAAIRAIVATSKLKQPVPSAAAQVLSTSELKQLVDTGVITKEQALATFDAK